MGKKHCGGRGRGSSNGGRQGGRTSTASRTQFSGDMSYRRRRFFDALVKKETATFEGKTQVLRFIEGMESFSSKAELMDKIEDRRDHGMKRIREMLSYLNSIEDVDQILVRILRLFLDKELDKPMYLPKRNKILMAIYISPCLMETLVARDAASQLHQEAAEYLCLFLQEISKAFMEARKSEYVTTMAKSLRSRGEVDAATLCAILLVDEQVAIDENALYLKTTNDKTSVCWVTDNIPPGGRHDNDERSFRDIQILPTTDELCCEAKPWLPLRDQNAIINDPATRLLDKHFRLLREDAISTIKENIEQQTRSWKNARIVDLDFTGFGKSKLFTFLVQLDSRPGGNPKWEISRALMQGSVVALCIDGAPHLMGRISHRDHETRGAWLKDPQGPIVGVFFEPHTKDFQNALIDVLKNLPYSKHESNEIMQEEPTRSKQKKSSGKDQKNDGGNKGKPKKKGGGANHQSDCASSKTFHELQKYDLVEASSSFFTYQPILASLQSKYSLPFLEELCSSSSLRISHPPNYLPDTLCMPKGKSFNGYCCSISSWSSADLVSNTSLDSSQADALHHAFTSRVSLIQGPPGTGKTFIGALIARMIRENTNQSILCICFTNHALDQFLEHMLDAGETSIVRLGGRSKSERLRGYGLRDLVHSKAQKTNFSRMKQIDGQLHSQREQIQQCIKTLKTQISWQSPLGGIQRFLQDEYPDEYECFPDMSEDADGLNPFGPDMFEDFWAMPHNARLDLVDAWKSDMFAETVEKLKDALTDYSDLVRERDALKQTEDLQILKSARVIGATTTGAANFKDLLASKAAGVIIIEEAGEVLESHVLSALHANSTKHLIMIGDHKQLRPKVENYSLSTVSGHGYDLDCSLFERLVLSNLPSATLNVQHRMRPEISQFIRSQTYPQLQDHSSVREFPHVKGVTQDVVFINHTVLEDGASAKDDDLGKTKSNTHEAELCVEIVRFFLLQGYAPSRIAILTPYLGQLMKILSLVRSSLREAIACVSEQDQRDLEDIGDENEPVNDEVSDRSVRCSTVDNFQGEEADLIVISLVRSNNLGNVGFLKEPQRVNVLMSRAKHGMFIVGNASALRNSKAAKKVWDPILDRLESEGRLLPGLPTYCSLHPDDDPIVLSKMEDWRTCRPNGGCSRPCHFRMECGHECTSSCHPNDKDHKLLQRNCCKPCKRVPSECPFGHQCNKLCKEDCGTCDVNVGNVRLNCGHSMDNVRCHQVCNDKQVETLTKLCMHPVSHVFTACGHTAQTSCGNANRPSPVCPLKCGKAIELCGHPCTRDCGSCEGDHFCELKCERVLFCGHLCGRQCHGSEECPPCFERCAVKCSHSGCPKKCHAPCASCVEDCEWECEHQGRCDVVCGAPCTRLPCDKRCQKKLECGHICPSVCGEPCPSKKYCQECGEDWVKSHVLDVILLQNYRDHDVDDDPIVVLPCGHFYASSTMDGHLAMSEVYEKCQRTGKFIGLKSLMDANVNEKPAVCPDCRSIIHSVRLYGRFLNLKGLRSLERKHMFLVRNKLAGLHRIREEGTTHDESKFLKQLRELEKTIMNSPMRKVKNACLSSAHSMEVPSPPVIPLLGTLELRGQVYSDQIEKLLKVDRAIAADEVKNKAMDMVQECFELAAETYRRGIAIADGSESKRSGATLRLAFASLLCGVSRSRRIPGDGLKEEADAMMDWIVANEAVLGNELVTRARRMKQDFDNRDILEVVMAMKVEGGYDFGGSWSSHWFECPNGHPYFIGNCGGAMQESNCLECGARVGGTSHNLIASNRRANGLIAQIRAAAPQL
ncbi:hypothetical protein FisN_12Lh085 [Fistulifera solaris]|uniref:RZ-type domain-containing protein n=1 Tax=Fistulifera solaris TaxID=1519565 RepID=A0A1Z5JMK9_FISSO|nr:hypothetical protein FisN_12Lh085 [Fistulifera solaris]|eukprot:GAX15209.1 hypothetical protein FisN_12Lh085 [Fistulifera solaris]